MNENFYILIKISPKFVAKFPVDSKSAVLQGNDLAPYRCQVITWTDDESIHPNIFVTQGLNELTLCVLVTQMLQSLLIWITVTLCLLFAFKGLFMPTIIYPQ